MACICSGIIIFTSGKLYRFMKYSRFISLILAGSLFLAACEEEDTPPVNNQGNKPALTPAEVLAKYKTIKEYAAEYVPDMKIGLGLGADIYIKDAAYRNTADKNFQIYTMGNAMKHSSVVKADGKLNFSLIDSFLAKAPNDIPVYGHNFIWHTQQNQQYLKSLIAPEMSGDGTQEEICENVVTNSGFENGTEGWSGFWGKYTYAVESPGRDGSGKAIHFTLSSETEVNYDAQLFWTLSSFLEPGVTYHYEFYAKSDSGLACQFLGQNADYGGIYKDIFNTGSDWTFYYGDFTYNEGDEDNIERVGLQFGGTPGAQIWIDDFKFGRKTGGSDGAYVYKTAEEKKTILLGAMESWIRQMAEHMGDRVIAWDVINEPIADGSNGWRGIDNVFNGQDKAPVEYNGLNLNWASDHWYWGYFIGKEYAVKAFEYARKYCASGSKLFVNDYNLEISPGKLSALVRFVNYIDQNNSTGGPLVDGIGTQMHVNTSITKEKVDDMFRVMAATGKLVRITELDVSVGTAEPTSYQLKAQAETYRMIIESYKENVPEAQQSGITVWTLSDAPAEHLYWLKDDAPNLFDGKYVRKLAYKYFCDGLAGKDISEDF